MFTGARDMDDDEMRLIFESQVLSIWKRKTQNCVLLNRQEYNAKLQRLVDLENPQVPKTPHDYKLLKLYDYVVQQENGTHQTRRLCKRGTNFLFVPIEEMFEILKNAHIQLRHGGRNSMQLFFRNKYCNITKDCIMTFLALCKQCPRKKKIRPKQESGDLNSLDLLDDDDDMDLDGPLHTSSTITSTASTSMNMNGQFSNGQPMTNGWRDLKNSHTVSSSSSVSETFSRGQLDVIDMRDQRDGEYCHIFKYTNLQTGEVRLRPMKFGTSAEAASLLVDIYCEQGAPVVIQSINGREFAKDVVSEVAKLWPSCRQLHGAVRMSGQTEAISDQQLIDQLIGIQKRAETNMWSQVLRFLQWELNTGYNNEHGRTAIENALGKLPSLGLPASKLLEAVYDKAQSEEQMMDYIADAELLRLSAFCSSACQQAQQQLIIPQQSQPLPRLHQQRPSLNATASVSVSTGHFIDESQLMPRTTMMDTKQPPSASGSYHLQTPSASVAPPSVSTDSPVFMDYQSLHMSVEQERQQQQQQQQHSVQHSPAQTQPPPSISQAPQVQPPPQAVFIQTAPESVNHVPPPVPPNHYVTGTSMPMPQMVELIDRPLESNDAVGEDPNRMDRLQNGPPTMERFPI